MNDITVERWPDGLYHAYRPDDVDPEGYPIGSGETSDAAIQYQR